MRSIIRRASGILTRISDALRASLLSVLPLVLGCLPALADEPTPPNILLILTDDQGWTSLSIAMDDRLPDARSDYHRTPHMDALAARGVRFSSGYAAAPVCSPTRYSILYGQTCARLRKTLVRGPNLVDHTQLSLPQAIKRADARYVCAHFGKWHIAVEPETVGFDVSDGKTTNREGGFNNGKAVEWSGYAADDPKLVDHVTDRGIAFMRDQAEAGRPFFLQLSHYAVHSDIVFRESTLREVERWPRGRTHQHAGYAAMIKDLDDAVGRLMRAFDDLDLADNTYVFFVSDNGGMPMIPPKRRDGVPYERALNAPLRSGKWDLTEGGLRVPFFVAGPGIAAGIQCNTPVVTYDLLPTFTDIAGASAFASPTLDGASLLPLLHDPRSASVKRPLGDTLVFHFPHYNRMGLGEPHSAIRQGPHKLIRFHASHRSLLFNLDQDPGERTDLSERSPDRAAAMQNTLTNYLESVDGEPPRDSVTWGIGNEGERRTQLFDVFDE